MPARAGKFLNSHIRSGSITIFLFHSMQLRKMLIFCFRNLVTGVTACHVKFIIQWSLIHRVATCTVPLLTYRQRRWPSVSRSTSLGIQTLLQGPHGGQLWGRPTSHWYYRQMCPLALSCGHLLHPIPADEEFVALWVTSAVKVYLQECCVVLDFTCVQLGQGKLILWSMDFLGLKSERAGDFYEKHICPWI